MLKVKLAGVTISVIFILLALVAWLDPKTLFQPPPQLEEFTAGIYAGHLSLPVLIADKYGFFEKNGLKVSLREYESGLAALKALARGETDMATAADFAFVNTSLENPDLRILATIATSQAHEIVARKDAGITSPEDLRGKKIGISPGTSSDFFLLFFLIFNKISPEEVIVAEIPPSQIVEALAAGTMDAVVAWDVYVYRAKQALAENSVSWPAQGGQDFYWLLVSTKGTIDSKPQAIEKFLKGVIMAQKFIRENEKEAKAMLAERWHFEDEYVEHHWLLTRFEVSLDQSLIAALEDGAAWNLRRNPRDGTQLPNYLRQIHFGSLDAVSPEAVTIFR